ncbi:MULTISPECIES: GTP-binding protein [Vagococcus]|uniref:Putative metal chaperone, involved in Zn homeostasis, GTPase of COG0523 family n=1 Tax=Vagococcus fluvialis bH819 TaxID=1255619 RepID=A0A1X6WLC0_9ENTE|nr:MULTISPECIES: GTP-binding protein [Vagococcus]SLM85114.1 Putative metal chaperone, involved in Zn homeostasis, GTPase of COG0523 family [Vagococcus fluvialis bH819]HCM88470.1 GTP-binding protein [Vagococcus sp.]
MSIPVTVISGFLGAGKTTLINQVLKGSDLKPNEVVIIENEFGEKGIDHELLIHSKENIFQMNGGCICCSLRTDLMSALTSILDVFVETGNPIKQVIIESSGVSDPQPIIQTLVSAPKISSHFYLDSVLVVVDNENFENSLVYPEVMKQIAMADRIFISEKNEMKVSRQLIEKIESMNPLTDFYPFALDDSAEMLASNVLNNGLFRKEANFSKSEDSHHHHHHEFQSLYLEGDRPIKKSLLENWLSGLMMNYQENIYRMKGFVLIDDQDFQIEIQSVNQLLNFNMTTRIPQGKVNELIIIGKNLDKAYLESSFKKIQDKSRE